MAGSWLILNSASGSHDPAQVERLVAALGAHGHPVDRSIALPDDDLPGAAEAQAGAPALIAVFGGDGTVSAAVERLEGWDGPLLVLPGGTMNLLSGKLHGQDVTPEAIVALALSGPIRTRRFALATGCGQRSLVGIIAGPTTAWGEVREDLRGIDLAGLAQSVPQALQQTLGGDGVWVEGAEGEYQAIFIEPVGDSLTATGIRAANIAEMAQHGFAWLTRDFLGGPTELLLRAPRVTIQGRIHEIGLLVDGEQAKAKTPCTFTVTQCPLNFVSTRDQRASPA